MKGVIVMHAWVIADHPRERCRDLRAEADRRRLVYGSSRRERRSLRRSLSRALLAFGSIVTSAGLRVAEDVPVSSRRSVA